MSDGELNKSDDIEDIHAAAADQSSENLQVRHEPIRFDLDQKVTFSAALNQDNVT